MKLLKTCFSFMFVLSFHFIYAQEVTEPKLNTIEITKPSILSTHPLGLLFTRLEGNYKTQSFKKIRVDFNVSSGNIWAPPVTAYIPNLERDRTFVRQFPWHSREFAIDLDTLDAKTIDVQNDGVIKAFNFKMHVPLNTTSEISITLKSFLLTEGKSPFTILTNDKFIEGFHDNIAGGDDPFDRKLYPFNKARIRYKDRNNIIIDLRNGDFVFSGIEAAYYYYPILKRLNEKNYYLNFGSHLGINTSRYNSSIDIGLNTNLIKSFKLNNLKQINIGLSIGAVYKKLFEFDTNAIDLGTNTNIGYIEPIIEYNYKSKKGRTHAFGIDFYLQTSLNKKDEFNYLIPRKNGTSFKSWNSGTANLYRNNNYWSFIYSITKKNTLKLYLQQDFTVNNHPDIQTGISYSFSLGSM